MPPASAPNSFSRAPAEAGALASQPAYVNHALEVADKWLPYQCWISRLPAASVGVFRDREVVFRGAYGYSNLETKRRAAPDTRYRVASISKVFTATAVMQLADRGRLQLDDPVGEHLGARSAQLGRITLRQLLTHLSGATRDGDTPHWVDGNFPSWAEMDRQLAGRFAVLPPLDRFKYSNFGYGLLGRVVEVRGGCGSYREYVEKRILRKLGLSDTYVDLTGEAKRRLATGYSRLLPGEARLPFEHYRTGALASAAGFISTVDDLCKFLMAHMGGGSPLISAVREREMRLPSWMSEDGSNGYGAGFQIWKVGDRTVVGHSGGFQGFASRVGFDAKSRVGVVILTNGEDAPARTLMEGVFHAFQYFEKLEMREKPVRTKKELRRYEGGFSNRWGDSEVVAVGRRLFALDVAQPKPMEGALELRRVSRDEFGIERGDNYDHIGERAVFSFDRGRVSAMKVGPNPVPSVPAGSLWKQEQFRTRSS